MECAGTAPFNMMHCRFTEVSVSRPQSADAKSQQDAIAELKDMPWEKLRSVRDDMCAKLDAPPSDSTLVPRDGTAKSAARGRALAMIRPLCGCRDATCVRAWWEDYLALERETCKVWVNSIDVDFKRVPGARKWISKSEPEGVCKAVTVIVIELDPADKSAVGIQWTYTETTVTADTTASPLCKAFELNVPTVYSWKALPSSFIECKNVEFGL
jgi:hypothetical protein